MKISLTLLILFQAFLTMAQGGTQCQTIYQTAEKLVAKGEYALAIKKLSAYKLCADAAGIKKADLLFLEIYETVNKQKIEAENATERANNNEKLAQQEKVRAEKAREEAIRNAKIAEESEKKAKARLKIMAARKLLADAIAAQNQNPPQWHQSMLLAEQAMKLYPSAECEVVLRKAMTKLPIMEKEYNMPGEVLQSSRSKKGNYVGIHSYGKTVIWNLNQLQKPKLVLEHRMNFALLNESPYVLTGSDQHKARLIDIETGKVVAEWKFAQKYVDVLAIHPYDQTALIKNSDTIGMLDKDYLPHGSLLLWNLKANREIAKLSDDSKHYMGRCDVAFMHDGTKETMKIQCNHGETPCWDIKTCKPDTTRNDQTRYLSQDGVNTATYLNNNMFEVKNTLSAAANNLQVIGEVWDFVFSPSGRYVLLNYRNSHHQLYDLFTYRMLWEVEIRSQEAWYQWEKSRFDEQENYLYLPHSTEIRSVQTGKIINQCYWSQTVDSVAKIQFDSFMYFPGSNLEMKDNLRVILLSNDGKQFATTTTSGKIHFWRIKDQTDEGNWYVRLGINAAAVSSENSTVYLGSDTSLMLLDARDPGLAPKNLPVATRVMTMAINETEKVLAYALDYERESGIKNGFYIRQIASGKEQFVPVEARIYSIDINAEGNLFLVGMYMNADQDAKKGLWLYDLKQNEWKKVHDEFCMVSPYEARFLGSDSLIYLWTGMASEIVNIQTGARQTNMETQAYAEFRKKTGELVCAQRDNLSIYDIRKVNSKTSIRPPKQFKGEICALHLSKNTDNIYVGIKDKEGSCRIICFDPKTGKEINNFEVPPGLIAIRQLGSDPNKIVAIFVNEVRIFDLSYTYLLQQCQQRKVRELTKEEIQTGLGEDIRMEDLR